MCCLLPVKENEGEKKRGEQPKFCHAFTSIVIEFMANMLVLIRFPASILLREESLFRRFLPANEVYGGYMYARGLL